MTRSAREIVEDAYRRFASGDRDALADALSEDVAWISIGPEHLPWAGSRRGPAGFQDYLRALGQAGSIERYEFERFIAEGDWVVVLVRLTVRHASAGQVVDYDKVDVFRVVDGRIAEFREYYDTATAVAAHRGV